MPNDCHTDDAVGFTSICTGVHNSIQMAHMHGACRPGTVRACTCTVEREKERQVAEMQADAM